MSPCLTIRLVKYKASKKIMLRKCTRHADGMKLGQIASQKRFSIFGMRFYRCLKRFEDHINPQCISFPA